MVGTIRKQIRFTAVAWGPVGAHVVRRANRILKALMIAVLCLIGAPVSASHAQAHFATTGQSQIAVSAQTQDDSDQGSPRTGGLEHHVCSCPCLEIPPTRSCTIVAFPDGSYVKYAHHRDTIASAFEPAPIRKPPRPTGA